tara:strand:- start:654 stop:2231 length:1578 start_codon:yes stop_codon:yes gene_type:complete
MALYDNPPQVDPATGRLPTYKQVLQQDPTTGVYKIKYEYTPIVSSSTAGQTLQTQLTTPVTTFPGISDSAGSGSDDDDTGGDTGEDTGGDTGGDTGTGGNQDSGQGGGDRGYYNFQGGGAQQGDGLSMFGSGETKTDFQKDLDSAYPGLATRIVGGIATALVASKLPGAVSMVPSGLVGGYRTTAANNVNAALEDGTAFTGLSLSQIEAIAESKRYPTEVTTAATNYIKNYNENQTSAAQTTSAFNTQVTQSYLDTLPDTPSQAVNPDLLADSAISTELRGSTKPTTDLDTFGYNQETNPTTSMTETTNYTNEDGTVETAPSGLQYASNVAQNNDGSYSQEQQAAAQSAVDGAISTGGSAYGMDDGVSAVGYGATTNDDGTTSYSGTVSWSGGTVTTGKKKDKDDGDSGNNERIICTELYRQGLLLKEDYILDLYYTSKHLTPQHTAGYWYFAVPAVKAMRRSKFWTLFFKHIATNRIQDIKWRLNKGKFNLKGRIYSLIFEPFFYISGYFKPNATYKELYKGEI